jgi:hypothetical protein
MNKFQKKVLECYNKIQYPKIRLFKRKLIHKKQILWKNSITFCVTENRNIWDRLQQSTSFRDNLEHICENPNK